MIVTSGFVDIPIKNYRRVAQLVEQRPPKP